MNKLLGLARSFLFVPANRPERFAKALASGADAVIIDLEDAVAPMEKALARQQLATAFEAFSAPERARLVVRINASATPWRGDDMHLVANLADRGLGGVMAPKAEKPANLQLLAQAVGPDCALLPLLETVAGLDAADALAGCPQVVRLVFGNLDFSADLGLHPGPDEAELAPVRLAVAMASRRAGLPPPVDGVTPDILNAERLLADAERARRGGFGGKLCIHPSQVAAVNAAFTPSAAEREWAQRVLAAFEAAGGGVVSLDGRMVDAPVVRLAQRTLGAQGPGQS